MTPAGVRENRQRCTRFSLAFLAAASYHFPRILPPPGGSIAANRNRLPLSGIPHLDRLLDGGIPARNVLLLIGAAGTGKTTFCLQVGFAEARDSPVLYVSTFSEPPSKLLRHIETFSFYNEELVGEGLHVRNLYPLIGHGLRERVDRRITADGPGEHVAFCQVGGDKDNRGTILGAYNIPFEGGGTAS